MSRALGRWIVLGVLGAIVIGLGIATSYSNSRLVEDLACGEPNAFSLFAERQDAYIFLQSEDVGTRLRIAHSLGTWKDASAAKLALLLIPEPDPVVRAALVDSLFVIAKRDPQSVAGEFGAGGAAESAALVEAAARDKSTGLEVLRRVLAGTPSSANGLLLAKRLGSDAEPLLLPYLTNADPEVRLIVADTLASLGLDEEGERRVAAVLLEMYRSADSDSFRDRLLPVLANLAPIEGSAIFRKVALDHTAPSDLRAEATRALLEIGDPIIAELASDADTNVAAAARR